MQTSPTRLKKPLHIWLARILGFGIILSNLATGFATLPGAWHKIQHEGNPQDVFYTLQPDGSKMVVYVSSEAAQKGIAIGDKLLDEANSAGEVGNGEVGTPFTAHIQTGNSPVREVTLVRKPLDPVVWGAMLFGFSQGTGTLLALLFMIVTLLLGTVAALLVCWLKSDDWMALLTGILLSNFASGPGTDAYRVILHLINLPLMLAWFLLFPNGKFAPRWSWMLIFLMLPNELWVSLIQLEVISYNVTYVAAYPFINALSSLGAVGTFGVIVYRYWRVFSVVERQQTKWAVLPLVVALAPSILLSMFSTNYWNSAQVQKAQMVDFVNSAIVAVGTCLIVLGILLSIFKYRLYDVDAVVSRAIVYSSLTGILALVGFIVIPLINYVMKKSLGDQSGLLAVLVSAVPIASLFNPVRSRIQQAVDHRFKPEDMNFEKTFIEFSSELRSLFSVKELSTLLARHAVEQLDIAYASVFLNGQDGHLRHITTICSDEATADPSLDDKTLEKIRKGQLASPDGEFARSLVIPLVIPRSRKPSLLGALFLGPRAQGVGYSTPMVKSLKKFGEDVGEALYAAEVKGNQKSMLVQSEA
jgi:hypothetical protein